jgi:hypothetical protein
MTTKRQLDAATIEALRGFVPFSSEIPVGFTPQPFRHLSIPEEFKPKFSIRSFTQAERLKYVQIYQSVKYDENNLIPEAELESVVKQISPIFRACLVGWIDYFDGATKEEIKFVAAPDKGCVEVYWNDDKVLPQWIRTEICEEVKKISCLTPIEKLSLK